MASPALPSASSALPALNPNQPTHSSPVPTIVSVSECGIIASLGQPRRLPTSQASTSPDTPALICTTVPPAKSSAPSSNSKPPSAQTMCAMGK